MDQKWLDEVLEKTIAKVDHELLRLEGGTPYIPVDGHYTDVAKDRGLDWWTNGF